MDWRTEIRNELARRQRRPAEIDDDVVEELSQHAESAWQAARADGVAKDAADGHVRGLIASWCAATNGPKHVQRAALIESAPASSSWFAGLGLDVRHAFRVLRRHRVFAVVSIAMIALGIAATSTVFSVMNGVLLKPLPWREPRRLVRLSESREGGSANRAPNILTNAAFYAWLRSPSSTIEGLGAWHPNVVSIEGEGGAEQLIGSSVSPGLFPLLGATPFIGRTFTDADAHVGATVILSYGLWQERFGGARDAVGKSIAFDGRPMQVIGVMPRDFVFPTRDQRYWVPFEVVEARTPGTDQLTLSMFSAIARLKPGVTAAAAAAEAEARVRASDDLGLLVASVFGGNGPAVIDAVPMLDDMTNGVRPAIVVMFVAVVLLFAAAIGNVANMQAAHAAARRREVAIRAAIGAGSARLARQLLVETSLTALAGGAIGLGLTAALLRVLPAWLPADFPRQQDIAIDARVAALMVGLTLGASLLTSVLPSRLARRAGAGSALVEDAASMGQGLRSTASRSRATLMSVQVAIAAVLIVGAALLGRSFSALLHADRGYRPENMMTARVVGPGRQPPALRRAFFDGLASRLAAIGGVTHVAYTNSLPLTGADNLLGFTMPSSTGGTTTVNGLLRIVSRDYFGALGMRVRAGRGFEATDTDSSEPVVLVNETFARAFLGDHVLDRLLPAALNPRKPEMNPWRVIGVVDDVRHRSATEPVQPEMFALVDQLAAVPQEFVVASTNGDPARLASEMRAAAAGLDRRALVDQVMTMDARLMASLSKPRLYAALLGGFAVFALLIAAIGLFGGLSYNVTQRAREMGLRSALGATPVDIVRLVVGQGAVMIAGGVVVGLAAAAASAKYLSAFLFGITPRDPMTFAVSAVALVIIGLVACAIPAWRAARIDAVTALKDEA